MKNRQKFDNFTPGGQNLIIPEIDFDTRIEIIKFSSISTKSYNNENLNILDGYGLSKSPKQT